MRLLVGHQHSHFWPILARFVDYYSLFWGPGVISTIDEPWGAFACQSSTLSLILARFMDYYSVLGSEVIPMIDEPGVCLRVGRQHS